MASVNMFDPVSIGSIRTRNRICIPPMVIYHISDETGTVKPQNVEHYRALAGAVQGLSSRRHLHQSRGAAVPGSAGDLVR